MILEHLPLARQIDLVFKEIMGELSNLSSGIVFIQIRNNHVGKFGVRHDPIPSQDGSVRKNDCKLIFVHPPSSHSAVQRLLNLSSLPYRNCFQK